MTEQPPPADDTADANSRNGGGWVKVWRKLDSNSTLQEADARGVFLTLLLRATKEPIKVFVRRINKHITLDEGQCYASIRDLAKLKLSRTRVQTILRNLENGDIIRATNKDGITVVTILNFHHYQERPRKTGTAIETATKTRQGQHRDTEQEGEEGEEGKRAASENAAGLDFEKYLFTRGKEVLGQNAGGLIARLRKVADSDPLTLHYIETASGKQDPREYVGAILKKRAPEPDAKFPGYVPMHPGAGG